MLASNLILLALLGWEAALALPNPLRLEGGLPVKADRQISDLDPLLDDFHVHAPQHAIAEPLVHLHGHAKVALAALLALYPSPANDLVHHVVPLDERRDFCF